MQIPDYTLEALRITRHSWDKVTATPAGRANMRLSLATISDIWPDRIDAVADAQWVLDALDQEDTR